MSEYPDFSSLDISTMTVMAYSNVSFDTAKLFDIITVEKIDEKNLVTKGKKKVLESSHEIVSVQSKTRVRGLNLRKVYKYHCPSCLKYNKKNKPVNTVIGCYRKKKNTDELEPYWECKDCGKNFDLEQIKTKKIDHFLNQITIVGTLNENIINVMVFKDNLKIVGCKSIEDARDMTKCLWDKYIKEHNDCYKINDRYPNFVFETVMANVGFKVGFPINRKMLNIIMNEEREDVFMSHFEPTAQVYVSIKMNTKKPKDFHLKSITYKDGKFEESKLEENPYKKKKTTKDSFNTFIVFSSSETILSGRHIEDMKNKYNYFMSKIMENKDVIEDTI